MKKVRASYYRRCADYVKWLGVSMFTVDESLPDVAEGTHSAVEAMYLYETHHTHGSQIAPMSKRGA